MKNVEIHPTALLDQPFRRFQGGREPYSIEYERSHMGENVWIGPWAIIGKGAVLHDGVVVDSHCIIEPNSVIGPGTLVTYRSIVGGDVTVGRNCVIGGFIGEGCSIGSDCRIFGRLLHRHLDTTLSWDEHDVPEPSPIIEDKTFIGVDALIIGGVRIGPRAYVTAGAIITRDVPPNHVATNRNELIPLGRWPGTLPC